MSAIAFEILLILLLIVANGVFAGSEIAVVSARKVRLEQRIKRGDNRARLALQLANSPNDFLSTVQVGITLIGILSGAVGGATIANRVAEALQRVPFVAAYREPLSLVIVVGAITYLSLVVGELVPKRLALNDPEQIACRVARPMQRLSRLTAPLVHLLSCSTEALLRGMGVTTEGEISITEEEIKALIQQATQAGMFEASEQEMVSRVFRLGDRSIKSLMTPRTSIVWLDIDDSFEDNRQIVLSSTHSRFPIGRGSLDNCLGIARSRDLLPNFLLNQSIDLTANLQAPLYVAENTRALRVLELFQETGIRIALVADEYGGIEGLVTLNDLVEAIVGELPSIDSQEEPQIIQREDGSYLLDGMLATDQLKELLQKERLFDEDGQYHTLGGFMITLLGELPTSGDYAEWEGFRFEVVDMDGTRIDKVLVIPIATVDAQPEEI